MKQAQLAQAESNLNAVEVQRENAFVKTPFAGVITKKLLDPGAMANVAQPIFRLEQMNPVKVIGSLVEKDLLSLQAKKTKATVRIALLNREFSGIVDKVYPAISAKTRTGEFELVIDNPDNVLRSGMYTSISLYLDTAKGAVIVPRDALLTQGIDMVAIRVNKDSIAERVKVRVGIVQNTSAQILEGLEPGDLIVSQGPELVKTGSRVKPILVEDKP
jgi:membrane fusion protein (multidrug efflux system)